MSEESSNAKGKPTPSRKEAELARKKAMKQPLSRREQMMRERERRMREKRKTQEALRSGGSDDAYLPPRDRGPIKALVRDVVDRRFNVAEYLLPILLLIIVLNLVNSTVIQDPQVDAFIVLAWLGLVVLTIFDEIRLVRAVKQAVGDRFGDDAKRGTTGYAVLRSTQLRRFRLPKVQIARGGPLRERY